MPSEIFQNFNLKTYFFFFFLFLVMIKNNNAAYWTQTHILTCLCRIMSYPKYQTHMLNYFIFFKQQQQYEIKICVLYWTVVSAALYSWEIFMVCSDSCSHFWELTWWEGPYKLMMYGTWDCSKHIVSFRKFFRIMEDKG